MRTPTFRVEPGERTRRVSLKQDGPTTGYADGTWWPRSRDLARELPALLTVLAARLGRVERVTYNLTVWDPTPRRLPVDGRVVRLEGFRSQSIDTLTAVGRGGQQRLTLMVVPPETDPATADEVLTRASRPGDAESIETLLAPARVAGTGPGTSNGGASVTQRWEGEGGSVGEYA